MKGKKDFTVAVILAVIVTCCTAIIGRFINWSRTKPDEVYVIGISQLL